MVWPSASGPPTSSTASGVAQMRLSLVAVVILLEFVLEELVNLAAAVHVPPVLEFGVLRGLEFDDVHEPFPCLLRECHRLLVRRGAIKVVLE